MRFIVLIGTLVLPACMASAGIGTLTPTSPSPSDIPRLEALLSEDSANVVVQVALGAAYRAAGRLPEARDQLERAVARTQDPAATLYLALTYEELHDYARARTLYERYIGLARASTASEQVRQRLRLVERLELQAAAKVAVASERQISESALRPGTVAVLPLRYVGEDPEYRPLGRALAAHLITDLSQTDRLTVLERLEVQAILDELALADRGVVDEATAAGSGRMLRAEHVVQGSIDVARERVELNAVIVAVADAAARSPVNESDALARIFDVEERLALSLYASLGIQLTATERERVLQRPTENLRALLAYGRGLEAEDRGDYTQAAREYGEAARLDPGFQAAGEAAERAEDIGQAVGAGVDQMASIAVSELAVSATAASASDAPGATSRASRPAAQTGPNLNPSPLGELDALSTLLPDPLTRDAGSEVLGREGVAASTILRIIFRRP
jgi:TolB-like protein